MLQLITEALREELAKQGAVDNIDVNALAVAVIAAITVGRR